MKVRCKFKCRTTGKYEGCRYVVKDGVGSYVPGFNHTAELYPVTGDSKENQEFFAATPGGKLELSVMVGQFFEPGKEYYIDIEEAPAAHAAG